MTERIENEAVAWVIPGDDHEDCNGFLDAMAYEHGEFTRPLYTRATIDRLIAEAVAAERERCAKIADAYADENIRMAGDSVLFDPVLGSKPGQPLTKEDFKKSEALILDGAIHSSMFHAAQNIAAAIRGQS